MKKYGKKMLAMFMSIMILMSVCSMSSFAAYGDPVEYDTEYTIAYSRSALYDQVNLWNLLEEELSYRENYDIVLERIDFWTDDNYYDINLVYGSLDISGSDAGTYEVDLLSEDEDKLYEDGYLLETTIYYWAIDDEDWEYEGAIEITIAADDFDLEYDMEGNSEFYLGEWLLEDLENFLDAELDGAYLDLDWDNECGTLYWDDYSEDEISYTDEYYYERSELAELYFVPNGAEGEFIIYYEAYDVDNNKIEGVITIFCDGGLLIEVDMTTNDVYTFDSEVFQAAVDDWDDDYTLIYIDNVKLGDSTDGKLYYDYEDDSTRNTEISSREEYYVDQSEEDVLDYISYVPSKSPAETVTISFDAFVEKRRGTDELLAGTVKINMSKAADITVYADKEKEVKISWKDFQDYLEEDIDSDDYEVAYVVISDAPRNEQNGYLICDGDDLTSRGDKTFYMDPSSSQYDLEDLSYIGGSKNGTYSATFKVYYYKSSTSVRATSTNEGIINFVVGASNTIENPNNPMKAAQVLSFLNELETFESLGNNDNVYITFTSLPRGGKLYYNYGLPTQKDVTVGTEYYIESTDGKQSLKNVTFVPSYSESKLAKVISFGVRGYNKNDKAITGTVNISVVHAYSSLYFSDITNSLYADSVDFLRNRGITEGVPGGKYDAAGSLTRGQVVTFLYRAAGSPAVTGSTTFKDVPYGEYYYNAVLWASQNGVTNGRNATVFDPNATVTNAEVIQFMYNFDVNYLKHTSYVAGSISSIADYTNVGDWATTAVRWALGKGVLTPGYLYPANVGTRGNIALYLHRMLTM